MNERLISRMTLMICLMVVGVMAMNSSNANLETKSAPYRHVVMFQFNDDATDDQIQAVVDAFTKLPEQISSIRDFEYGTNISPEGLNKGLTHCFFVTFDNKADLQAYLPHPAHQDFVKVLRPVMKDVCVLDYIAQQ